MHHDDSTIGLQNQRAVAFRKPFRGHLLAALIATGVLTAGGLAVWVLVGILAKVDPTQAKDNPFYSALSSIATTLVQGAVIGGIGSLATWKVKEIQEENEAARHEYRQSEERRRQQYEVARRNMDESEKIRRILAQRIYFVIEYAEGRHPQWSSATSVLEPNNETFVHRVADWDDLAGGLHKDKAIAIAAMWREMIAPGNLPSAPAEAHTDRKGAELEWARRNLPALSEMLRLVAPEMAALRTPSVASVCALCKRAPDLMTSSNEGDGAAAGRTAHLGQVRAS